jgi:hypothetical protein
MYRSLLRNVIVKERYIRENAHGHDISDDAWGFCRDLFI